MNLIVRIHDKEYKNEVVQGVTFSEEYNETLDSGTVRLTHVIGQIKDLKPYDDVYIYESDSENDPQYFEKHIADWKIGGELHDGDEPGIPFYRHLLVDKFAEDIINLSEGIYSYTIELFSETRGLEAIQCPNISITQPLKVNKKIDIYTHMLRFVAMYSPKRKVISRNGDGTWFYQQKYTVDPSLSKYKNIYCQDFSLSNPTLKDVLSNLLLTQDSIPYVKDDVIYARDITQRVGQPYQMDEEQATGRISRIASQMTSDDYCDNVRRQYSNALSSNGICHYIETLGFRNRNEKIMTLSNMEVESMHKLYKIDSCFMCYYKNATVTYANNQYPFVFLCRQDITPLIKNTTEWNLLEQDWRKFTEPTCIEDLSQFKISTVHYDIGGNSIKGWGTRYTKLGTNLLTTYDITKTYIENIFSRLNSFAPFGVSDVEEIKNYYKKTYKHTDWDNASMEISPAMSDNPADIIYYPSRTSGFLPNTTSELSGIQKLKTIFFQMEYEGFFDGALIHTRDKGNDNICQNDNSSASLTIVEKDGIAQKEKLNRFANKTYTMSGRLSGENYSLAKLLKLGQTGRIGEDDDVIIYRREYSIYNNYILVSYAGVQDYVLKNFYTNVYSKYRTYQLMSYSESVNRSESEKAILLLSKTHKYKNERDSFFRMGKTIWNDIILSNDVSIAKFFSAFLSSDFIGENNEIVKQSINGCYINTGKAKFSAEEQSFTSGNNVCFNIAFFENNSAGTYIENWTTDYATLIESPSSDNKGYYVGSNQNWYSIVDDDDTGFVNEANIKLFNDRSFQTTSTIGNVEYICKTSALLPYRDYSPEAINSIISVDKKFYKDNKERLDVTFQIEPIAIEEDKDNIVFGELLGGLSDLVSEKKWKTNEDITVVQTVSQKYDKTLNLKETRSGIRMTVSGSIPYEWEWDDFFTLLSSHENHTMACYAQINGHLRKIMTKEKKFFTFKASAITYTTDKTDGSIPDEDDGSAKIIIKGTGHYIGYEGNEGWFNEIEFKRPMIPSMADGSLSYSLYFENSDLFNDDGIMTLYANPTILYYNLVPGNKTSVLEKNMFVQYYDKKINRTWQYKTLPSDTNKSIFSEDRPQDVFIVESDRKNLATGENIFGEDGDNTKIRIDLSNAPAGTKSVIYWYFDANAAYTRSYDSSEKLYEYTPSHSAYYFVFGVNVTEAELAAGETYVYISKVISRDKRIFDIYGRQIGINHDYGQNVAEEQKYDANVLVAPITDNLKTITIISATGSRNQTYSYFKGEVIEPNYISPSNEYGSDISYWVDSKGDKHDQKNYFITVKEDETFTFYGQDWFEPQNPYEISQSLVVPGKDGETTVDVSIPDAFHIAGAADAYPIAVLGEVTARLEYDGQSVEDTFQVNGFLNPVNAIDGLIYASSVGDATGFCYLWYVKENGEYKMRCRIAVHKIYIASEDNKGDAKLDVSVKIKNVSQSYTSEND